MSCDNLSETKRISYWFAPGRVMEILSNELGGLGIIEIIKVSKDQMFPEGFACLDVEKHELISYDKIKNAKVQAVWDDRELYLKEKFEEAEEE